MKNTGQKLWRKSKKIIPGGNMLLSKRPEMFSPKKWPVYYKRSKGCYVWTLDNIKFVDMGLMGVGTNILGYSNTKVEKAVYKAVKFGNVSSLNCKEELDLAKKLIQITPKCSMVKFARTGGEAAAIAIRIARSLTKKNLILACGYHGWHDWYISSNIKNKKKFEKQFLKNLDCDGIPKKYANDIILFEYNDIKNFIKILKSKSNLIAAVIMEVERNLKPKNNFLKKINIECKKKKIPLIFDECTSGFRETYGGLYKKYKLDPDAVLFGKSLGNGYPITAIVGKKKFMNSAQKTFISSTFWSDRIGPAAALSTLKIMKEKKSWIKISNKGKFIKKNWEIIFKKYNFDVEVNGIDAMPAFNFKSSRNNEFKTFLIESMLEYNFLTSNTIYLSLSHKSFLIKKYLKYFEKSVKKLKKILEKKKNKKIVKFICHSSMKRLN